MYTPSIVLLYSYYSTVFNIVMYTFYNYITDWAMLICKKYHNCFPSDTFLLLYNSIGIYSDSPFYPIVALF